MEALKNVSITDFSYGENVASGNFGEVFKVQLKRDGGLRKMFFAKKVLELSEDNTFDKEVKLNKKVNGHPNVVSTLCFGKVPEEMEDEGMIDDESDTSGTHSSEPPCEKIGIIIFEWCGEGDLTKYIETNGSFSETCIVKMCRDMALGLQHLHSHGIVHTDLHPRNILIQGGVCKIGDLGCASSLRNVAQQKRQENKDSAIGASTDLLAFLSPQAYQRISPPQRGQPNLSENCKDDVYSLGTIYLYLFKSGRIPKIDKKFCCQSDQRDVDDLIRASRVQDGVQRCMLRMLQQERESRYSSDDVVLALSEWYGMVVEALA